jgi:hypothetical protein
MMRSLWSDEAGHTSFFLTALLAAVTLIVLTFGLARDNATLVWVGGVGAAALVLGVVGVVHDARHPPQGPGLGDAGAQRSGRCILTHRRRRWVRIRDMSRRLLDSRPVRNKEVALAEFVANLTVDDLRELTNDMVDTMLDLIADCVDADVTFVPEDPDAHDTYARDPSEAYLPWTLGHVIVHTTASAEESAAIAAELARGVKHHGRSRYEVPWRTVTTIQQCRRRLEESRRMRLASLGMWPDEPHLDNAYTPFTRVGEVNAIGAFVLGLAHDSDHLGQIAEIVRQAKAARAS